MATLQLSLLLQYTVPVPVSARQSVSAPQSSVPVSSHVPVSAPATSLQISDLSMDDFVAQCRS